MLIFLNILYGALVLLNYSTKFFGASLKLEPRVQALLVIPHDTALYTVNITFIGEKVHRNTWKTINVQATSLIIDTENNKKYILKKVKYNIYNVIVSL